MALTRKRPYAKWQHNDDLVELPSAAATNRGRLIPTFLEKIREKEVVVGEDEVKSFNCKLMKPLETSLEQDTQQLVGMLKGSPKIRLIIRVLRDQALL